MKVKVYAKLNLTLNVTGVSGGFHDIDSVAVSVDVYDEVSVLKRTDGIVTVSGCDAVKTEDNSAYKAALAFKSVFGTGGADITIRKAIPFSSGMGGSSADAVGVVYCMSRLFGICLDDRRIYDLCKSLGSDLNFMLRGGLARLRGKGDDVDTYSLNGALYFALTTFERKITSKQAYSAYDALNRAPSTNNGEKVLKLLSDGNAEQAIRLFGNDLQPAVKSLSDYAQDYLDFCAMSGLRANMTGSGSAYYVAFADKLAAEKTADMLSLNGFKTFVCQSVPCGIEEI